MSELTQVPRRQGRSRRGARLSCVGVEDGAIGLVVDHAGHVATLLVLAVAAPGARTGLEVGVTARSVTADGTLVSAMRAGLEGQMWFIRFLSLHCTLTMYSTNVSHTDFSHFPSLLLRLVFM